MTRIDLAQLAISFANHLREYSLDDGFVNVKVEHTHPCCAVHLVNGGLRSLLRWADTLEAPYVRVVHATSGIVHVYVHGALAFNGDVEATVLVFDSQPEHKILTDVLLGNDSVAMSVEELQSLADLVTEES